MRASQSTSRLRERPLTHKDQIHRIRIAAKIIRALAEVSDLECRLGGERDERRADLCVAISDAIAGTGDILRTAIYFATRSDDITDIKLMLSRLCED